jgi:cysteine desulfuration protein SufE
MPKLLTERLSVLTETFEFVTDVNDRIEILIDYADRFKEVPENIAKRPFPENHRVPFCESEAYVWLEQQPDQTLKLHFAVENPQGISAKALAAILDQTLSGLPAEQISEISPDLVFKLFGRNISMGKGQGLMAMVSMVKSTAKKIVES